jgi:hypothetical protein
MIQRSQLSWGVRQNTEIIGGRVEHYSFTWHRGTPEEEAAHRAVEPRIAGFRVEPAQIVLRVGERNPLWPICLYALDERGRDIKQISGRYEGVADSAIAEYAPLEGLLGVAPGRTHFALIPGNLTREGKRPILQIEIIVRSA